MVSLLIPVIVVVVIVLVVRKVIAREGSMPSDGHTVRRVFQYLLHYGLFVVVAIGLSGLLGRILQTDAFAAGGETALARDLAFLVVGGPLLVVLVLWSRRSFAQNPVEARSLGWATYVGAAALTALLVFMTALHQLLEWVTGLEEYDGLSAGQALVWGGAWVGLWWLDARLTPRENARAHLLLGSLIGLVVAAVGLGGLLAASLRVVLGLDVGSALVGSGGPLRGALVTLAVGAPVWVVYWARSAVRSERSPLWHTYVLLAGVGGGLVTAIVTGSSLLYTVLVWLIGEPRYATATLHFDGAPPAAAAAAIGALVWSYHHAVLRSEVSEARNELRRIYEYLISALGLFAAAGGLTVLVAALVEAVSGTALVSGEAVNTLLAAATLLIVGGSVWWRHWRMVQTASADPATEETASPTRRLYLLILFGVGALAAVVALIVGVYLLFVDVVEGTLGTETLRRMRFALGVLLTTASVAGYHWKVFRADRDSSDTDADPGGPRFVLLVGPADPEIARAVAQRTHGRVQAWARTDDGETAWSVEEVMAALSASPAEEMVVLCDSNGLQTIPVHRT